jgi:exonuclease III
LAGHWRDPRIHADVLGSDHCPVSLLADAALFA